MLLSLHGAYLNFLSQLPFALSLDRKAYDPT